MVSHIPSPTPLFALGFALTLTRKSKSSEKVYQPMASVYYCHHKLKCKNGVGLGTRLYNILASGLSQGLYKYYNMQMVISTLVLLIRLGVGL